MLLKSIAVAAGLATTAVNAFLVVPQIADNEIVRTLPIELPESSHLRSIKLDCPGCPLPMRNPHHKGISVKTNIPNHLELTFTVDSDSVTDRLLVNGFELYPNADPWANILRAPQVPDFIDQIKNHPHRKHHHAPKLGYSLAVRPLTRDENGTAELIGIDMQIIEVGETFVDNIPGISVKLVKTSHGMLLIGDVTVVDSVAVAQDPSKCTTMMCKWRALVAQQIQKLKSFKKCGAHLKHGSTKTAETKTIQYQPHHTWRQLFKSITSHILLPIFIGILAGVSVSIIGMMVGTFVVCLWRVFVRRQPPFSRKHCRRRGHSCHKATQQEVAPLEEKTGLMADLEDTSTEDTLTQEDPSKGKFT